MRRRSGKMTRGEAVFLLIAGILLGTVFTFGEQYWNAPISRDEAVPVSAVFSSCREWRSRSGSLQQITVSFEDHESLDLDGVYIDTDLRTAIGSLSPGTMLSLMVHPHSDTILEMYAGPEMLLDFDDSVRKLTGESRFFFAFGVFWYLVSLAGLTNLLKQGKRFFSRGGKREK